MQTSGRIAAERRDELVDALCAILTELAPDERAGGAPTDHLDLAVTRWSRDVPAPADVLGLVAQVRARTRDNRTRRHAEVLARAELVGVEAVARRHVREALTDPLSGLATRVRLEEEARHLVASCARSGSPLTVVLLDVDGLKRINDEQGHVAGDAAIAEAGRAIRTHLRAADHAFRYGGDEFALFLPGTTVAGARVLVERVQRSCATPLSAGVAAHSGRAQDVDVAAWLSEADADLYGRRREERGPVAVRRPRRRLGLVATAVLAGVAAAGVGLAVPVALRTFAGGEADQTPAAPAVAVPAAPRTAVPVRPGTATRAPHLAPAVAPARTAPVVVVVRQPVPLPAVPTTAPVLPPMPTALPTVLPTSLPTPLPTVLPTPAPSTPGLVGGLLAGVGQLLDALL